MFINSQQPWQVLLDQSSQDSSMGQGRSPKASLLVEEMLGEEESVLSGDVASCMLPLPQCTTLHPNTYGSILIGLSEFYI